jgi:DNA-directed RNA polymerase specialized sigma24 family protein
MNMDESAERWMYKYAWANYWRVASWYDIDDLIQDGFMCWWIVSRRYTAATDMAHLMSLFKTTFVNHVHTLANTRSKQPDLPVADCLAADETETTFIERHDTGAEDLRGIVHAAPAVRNAINALLSKAHKLRGPTRRHSNGKRQTTNDKLCTLAGCNSSMIDLVSEIKYCLGD